MPHHIVVDGSNLATEGRSMPSLKQLSDAVEAYLAEFPTPLVTVVVDATFGHRIDSREVAEFEEAIEHNELVAPPAGAVGRGDAFVLAIANKVNAVILSNDSFQEFHGQYPWLFDEGRLVGGKPVPHVGWVFVERVPVRGPLSRKSTRQARQKDVPRDTVRTSSASLQPMPVPKAPPPRVAATRPAASQPAAGRSDGDRSRRGASASDQQRSTASEPTVARQAQPAAPARNAMVNDLMPFLEFVEKYPVGTMIDVAVETYSSHGAYVTAGGARAYLPLRNISDPAPRSARELFKLGETVSLQVAAFHPARRGIDLAVAGIVAGLVVPEPAKPAKPARKSRAAAIKDAPEPAPAPVESPAAMEAPTVEAAAKTATQKPARRGRTQKPDRGHAGSDDAPVVTDAARRRRTKPAVDVTAVASTEPTPRLSPPMEPVADVTVKPVSRRRTPPSTKSVAAEVVAPAAAAAPVAVATKSAAPRPARRGKSAEAEATPAAPAAAPTAAAAPPAAKRPARGAAKAATEASAVAVAAPASAKPATKRPRKAV